MKRKTPPKNILGMLMHMYLTNYPINEGKWVVLGDLFLSDKRNGINQTKEDILNAKGNIHREFFTREAPSWKSFEKFMRYTSGKTAVKNVIIWEQHFKHEVRVVKVEQENIREPWDEKDIPPKRRMRRAKNTLLNNVKDFIQQIK